MPGAVEETDAEIARLRAGDCSGVVTLDCDAVGVETLACARAGR
ncbi:hypothetical protein ACFWPV_16650 [Streptomyces uncialis]